MQDLVQESLPRLRYCYAILAEWLPEKVLRADNNLRRLVKSGGKCFARVMRRTSWDTFLIRVSADACHLGDKKLSHLVEVPISALPSGVGVGTLMAAAIPPILLDEDAELRGAVEKYGGCPAMIEAQLSWDMFRVRIATEIPRLGDKNRSHVIFLSNTEVRAYLGYAPEKATPVEVSDADGCMPSPLRAKAGRLTRLVSVQVSREELIAGAEEVGISPRSASVLPRRGSPSWLRFSQQLNMALYRVLLHSISHRRVLRKKLCRAFWAGRLLGKWLIEIRAVPIEDRPGYWCLRARIPSLCA